MGVCWNFGSVSLGCKHKLRGGYFTYYVEFMRSSVIVASSVICYLFFLYIIPWLKYLKMSLLFGQELCFYLHAGVLGQKSFKMLIIKIQTPCGRKRKK